MSKQDKPVIESTTILNECCPLCAGDQHCHFYTDKKREYWRCCICELVFVPRQYHLSAVEEKSYYDLHENNSQDEGYRRFLSRMHKPMSERIQPQSRGLDFGSGPGPVLASMFADDGHIMSIHDIYYSPDQEPLKKTYNFVTATEVVEHVSSPRDTLQRLWTMVEPSGWLGLMTKLVRDREAFATWHYKNDPTHICFFSVDTFTWLAKKWGVIPEFIGADVIIMQKPAND
jgi:hypothetical protein